MGCRVNVQRMNGPLRSKSDSLRLLNESWKVSSHQCVVGYQKNWVVNRREFGVMNTRFFLCVCVWGGVCKSLFLNMFLFHVILVVVTAS
jgi:hypothetical protein